MRDAALWQPWWHSGGLGYCEQFSRGFSSRIQSHSRRRQPMSKWVHIQVFKRKSAIGYRFIFKRKPRPQNMSIGAK